MPDRIMSGAASIQRTVSSAFIIGEAPRAIPRTRSRSTLDSNPATENLPYLSYQPTVGRNSRFLGLSLEQKDELGGIEYRSLRLLVKTVASMTCCYLPLA